MGAAETMTQRCETCGRLRAALVDMIKLARSGIETPTIEAWDRIHAAEAIADEQAARCNVCGDDPAECAKVPAQHCGEQES